LLHSTTRIEGGADSVAFDFLAETIRSLLPRIVDMGVATEDEVNLETIAERFRAEAIAGDNCLILPRLVGAWARVPAT
jgi:hypothetical protein